MDSCTKRPPTKRVLSICSGIGGIELGLAALEPITGERFETICYLELEISAGRVLAKNIQEGKLGDAPIWTDIRTFNTEPWSNKVDIIVGGFPCQPHSQAGKQLHGDDPRELSGEVLRIAAGLGYPTLFLENVPGISRYYWDNIRPKLRAMGYRIAETFCSAEEIGAPQKRTRFFVLAYSNSNGSSPHPGDYGKECRLSEGDSQQEYSSSLSGRGSNELADSTSPELDDSEHNGYTSPKEPRDVDPRTRQGEAGEVNPEQPPRSGSSTGRDNELAYSRCIQRSNSRGVGSPSGQLHQGETNSSSSRSQELADSDKRQPVKHQQSEGGRHSLRENRNLADSNSIGRQVIGENEKGREFTGQPQPVLKALAHAERIGAQGETPGGHSTEQWTNGNLSEALLFPPGPGDTEGWARVLSEMPEIKPSVCRVSHGVPPGYQQRIRALGNAVVPAVAAYAWVHLNRAFEREVNR